MTHPYGPWAIITGASDGIGRAIAHELAKQKINLVLVARRQPELQSLADTLQAQDQIKTKVICADMASPQAIEQLLLDTQALEIGLLVASAGFGTSGLFIDNKLEHELNMIDVNCRAVVSLTHRFAQRFIAQRRGGIILFSSLVAFQGVPHAANYAATKAFIQTFAEGLRHELSPHNVEVIACAPGPVQSGFAARPHMNMGATVSPQTVAAQTLKALGRWSISGTIRPGWLSKLLIYSLATLPRWARVLVMSRIMGSMAQRPQLPSPQTP